MPIRLLKYALGRYRFDTIIGSRKIASEEKLQVKKSLIFDIDKNVVTHLTHYMVCQWVEAILRGKKTKVPEATAD